MPAYSSAQQHKRMMETPILPLLVSLSVPTILSQMVTVIYNTADTWFVSQISTSASAAVGVCFALMSIIQAFGFGIGMGSGSLISRKLGARQDGEAHVIASSGLAASFCAGLLLAIICLPILRPLMTVLGSTETVLPHAMAYARIILLAAPIMCSSFVLNNVLRAEGMSRFAMIGLCSGGILNMVLDPVFIFLCHMDIAGAALATAISQCVSFTVLLSAFLRGKSIVRLHPTQVSRSFAVYGSILTTGFPTICRQGWGSLSTALLNSSAALYGDAAVAAVSIVNKVYNLVRNIVLGLGQGAQPIMGYNFGAGDRTRTRRTFWVTTAIGTVLCCLTAVGVALGAGSIIGWFRNDPAVIAIGSRALLFACAVMPFMAYSTYVNQLYQCLGFRCQATILASCRQGICFVPLALTLPRVLGLTGVQLLQPGADLATFLISIPFLIWFLRHPLREDAVNA